MRGVGDQCGDCCCGAECGEFVAVCGVEDDVVYGAEWEGAAVFGKGESGWGAVGDIALLERGRVYCILVCFGFGGDGLWGVDHGFWSRYFHRLVSAECFHTCESSTSLPIGPPSPSSTSASAPP